MKYHDTEYNKLKSLIAEMSTIISKMLSDSLKALIEKNIELAEEVIERDNRVDELEVEIDELCHEMLALYEPKAVDLRSILTASKIVVDLERIGDHSVKICQAARNLIEVNKLKPCTYLPKMVKLAVLMIKDSVNAYFSKDTELALDIIARDDYIDSIHSQSVQELVTCMLEDSSKIRGSIKMLSIVDSVERIADYTTNIAEQVYFMVTGTIIRHTQFEGLENENSAN